MKSSSLFYGVLFVFMTAVFSHSIEGKIPQLFSKTNTMKNNPMKDSFDNWAIQEGLTPNDVSPHLRSTSSSSYGWVYYNQYTDDTCDSPVTMQSASVAYQCFQTEMVNGTKYSQMITCGESKRTTTLPSSSSSPSFSSSF